MKVSGLTIRKPDSVWTFLKKKKCYNFDDSWKTKEDLSKRRVIPQWALDKKNKMNANQTKLLMIRITFDNYVYTVLVPYKDI